MYLCYTRKKSKNAYKKRKNESFEKKKMRFFLMSQGSFNPKSVPGSSRTDGQTDTHESEY